METLWNTTTVTNKNQLNTHNAYMCSFMYNAQKNLLKDDKINYMQFRGGGIKILEFRHGRKTYLLIKFSDVHYLWK